MEIERKTQEKRKKNDRKRKEGEKNTEKANKKGGDKRKAVESKDKGKITCADAFTPSNTGFLERND